MVAPAISPTIRFAELARTLGAAARAAGLSVPAFRSPPRLGGARRTIRRYPGGAVVAVEVRDRPSGEVASDMVEGIIVANRLDEPAATSVRMSLRRATSERRVPAPLA